MDARETAGDPPLQSRRPSQRVLLACLTLTAGIAAGWTLWPGQNGRRGNTAIGGLQNPEWPQSPWKNARLDVEYVGDTACARCHEDIAEKYSHHPMGRSLAPLKSSGSAHVVDKLGNRSGFESGPFRFSVEERNGHVFHKETGRDAQGNVVAEVEHEVKYTMGSGARGIAFLVEHDGRLFQSPIAWYGQKQRWDLAPGYQHRNFHFDRTIEPQCLFCHANRVQPVDLTVGQYKEPIFQGYSIGCERCHGPGRLHVRAQEPVGDRDPTIVNPRHLEPALREAVCEQCHLQGDYRIERPGRSAFDYRPGLPLSTFLTVLERATKGGNKAVGHVEQMHASRCFRASEGRLGCVSCHDPHTVPARDEKSSYYRRQCLACHERKPCSLPDPERLARSPDDNCVSCHMPVLPNTDIVHNATTDHRILRFPQIDATEQPELTATGPPLAFFHSGQLDPKEREAMSRELAIGLVYEARRTRETPRRTRAALAALGVLDKTLARWPDDFLSLRAKAQALAMSGRAREGFRIYDELLKRVPDYEQALDERVSLALEQDDREGTLIPARRAVAVNPWSAEFHERLAHYQLVTGDWNGVLQEADKALALNPFLAFARQFRIQCYLHQRDLRKAEEELEILIALNPVDREARRLWFAQERRRFGS